MTYNFTLCGLKWRNHLYRHLACNHSTSCQPKCPWPRTYRTVILTGNGVAKTWLGFSFLKWCAYVYNFTPCGVSGDRIFTSILHATTRFWEPRCPWPREMSKPGTRYPGVHDPFQSPSRTFMIWVIICERVKRPNVAKIAKCCQSVKSNFYAFCLFAFKDVRPLVVWILLSIYENIY